MPLTSTAELGHADNLAARISAVLGGLDATLGRLVDTDLSKESARLQALVIRQQLRTHPFPLAADIPMSLRSLFR